MVVDTSNKAMPSGWAVSENGNIIFSATAQEYFLALQRNLLKEPEDTLLEEEKYKLDIWSWDDDLLQPMQKKQLDQEKKRTYRLSIIPEKMLCSSLPIQYTIGAESIQKGNSRYALGSSDLEVQEIIIMGRRILCRLLYYQC